MRMTMKENDLLLKCSNTLVVNLYIPIIICSIIVRWKIINCRAIL